MNNANFVKENCVQEITGDDKSDDGKIDDHQSYHVRNQERSSPILVAQFWKPGYGFFKCFQLEAIMKTYKYALLSSNHGKVLPPDISEANSDSKGGYKKVNWVCPFLSDDSKTFNIINIYESMI